MKNWSINIVALTTVSSIIKKKKKNIQRSQWSFWHSNEFHKIFLELFVLYYYNFIQLILILSFHLATKPRRLQNWNIPFFNFNKKNFVESFFKSIIFFIIVIFLFIIFSTFISRKDCWERYLWEETIGELGQIRIPHFY